MGRLHDQAKRVHDAAESAKDIQLSTFAEELSLKNLAMESVILAGMAMAADASPRLIRTVEELDGLDPATVFVDADNFVAVVEDHTGLFYTTDDLIRRRILPGVILATGEQVSAARAVLEGIQ